MTAPSEASEQRELLIDDLIDLPVQDFTECQLRRLSRALERALDAVETEYMRRNALQAEKGDEDAI